MVAAEWKMRIATNAATDVPTAEVIHPEGNSSGWHKHPGPVIITVVERTLTFYFGEDSTCSPTRVHAGKIRDRGGRRPQSCPLRRQRRIRDREAVRDLVCAEGRLRAHRRARGRAARQLPVVRSARVAVALIRPSADSRRKAVVI